MDFTDLRNRLRRSRILEKTVKRVDRTHSVLMFQIVLKRACAQEY